MRTASVISPQKIERKSMFTATFQVWVIPETNEVFTDYEPYLQRMDFYKQRRFICEITGHSGLTFFEALRSEVCQCLWFSCEKLLIPLDGRVPRA